MTPLQLQELIHAVHMQGDLAHLCMQMFYVFLLTNQLEAALEMQSRALQIRRVYRMAGSKQPQLRLLVVMGPGHMQHNTPIEFVTHGQAIQTEIIYMLHDEPVPMALPDHDVTFIAIGESSKNNVLLGQLDAVMKTWPTPVVNAPRAIKNCARSTCYKLLKESAGVIVPQTKRVRVQDNWEMDFPVTLRPIDTHGGEGLQRINDVTELANYYATVPAEIYHVAKYVDYQSPDGYYRKLRIALIDGVPFICHMAISAHWNVHYRTAGMETSLHKRVEEQRMMEQFDQDFSIRFNDQLAAVARALQLDYVIVDCAQSRCGRLLVFEVDSRGIIHAADPQHIYPYKPAVMQKAFDAFQALLLRKHASSSSM